MYGTSSGYPNVGKSSIINTLMGKKVVLERRMKVQTHIHKKTFIHTHKHTHTSFSSTAFVHHQAGAENGCHFLLLLRIFSGGFENPVA